MTKRNRLLRFGLVAAAATAALFMTAALFTTRVPPWLCENDDIWGISST
jgi:hypothetical protein